MAVDAVTGDVLWPSRPDAGDTAAKPPAACPYSIVAGAVAAVGWESIGMGPKEEGESG